jgi:hypothetical protein
MQRDMDLIRRILLYTETNSMPSTLCFAPQIEGYTAEQIGYHIVLLKEADFIDAVAPGKYGPVWGIRGLTWAGHDFLDAARNDTLWESTKRLVKDKAGSVSLDVLKALLVEGAKKMLLAQLGP